MSEVVEQEMELENEESWNYKVEDGDFCSDEIEKKTLIQPEVEKLDEKSDKTTYFQTLMHFLKVNIGTGILGLPVAVMNAGVVVGPVVLFILAIITTHCMLLLVKSARELSRISGINSSLDYGDTAEESFRLVNPKHARIARITVNATLCIGQVGILIVCVLFLAKNLEQIMKQLNIIDLNVEIWIIILCPILVIFIMIKNLSSLAWVSTMANCLMAFGILSIFVHLIPNVGSPLELPKFSGWSVFPLCIGVAVFAFDAMPIVLPLENEMKEPKQFPRVVKLGMGIVVVIYVTMGFLGYLYCQNVCKGSITLNLPGTPFFSVVKLMVAIAAFSTYFIEAYVPLKIVEPWIFEQIPEKMYFLTDILIRILLVMLTCGLAAAVPQLHNVISLVGAFSMTLLGFIFPIAIHSATFYDKLSRLELAKNFAILFVGILGCLAGTYTSVHNIIKEFQRNKG